jgi:lysophospholipase L1-like esterase
LINIKTAQGSALSLHFRSLSKRNNDHNLKRILCYGDSNTWGFDPCTKTRFGYDNRWTGVLQESLSIDYFVIEEGLMGRTTNLDDPVEGCVNGASYLPNCLLKYKPIDLAIILLGTNDLKKKYARTTSEISNAVGTLVDIVKGSGCGRLETSPKVLLVAPPPISKLTEFAELFKDGEQKSMEFAQYFKQVAQDRACLFLDSSLIVRTCQIDGIHFEKADHIILGRTIAQIVMKAV